ncbi:MAG TPA: hypothetical protein VJI75_00515 [Candidatus Nanoarchaeia archaeon]|nr:hypothetical protein [Candidatus Nanoarchaeia archaeon]
MWPFSKKAKPDAEAVKKLEEQDKNIPSEEQIGQQDAEFRDQGGEIMTKSLRKMKRI